MSIIKCYPKVTILGDMPSKSNQYRIITIKGHSSLCKTAAVKKYEENFYKQNFLRESNNHFCQQILNLNSHFEYLLFHKKIEIFIN